LLAAEILNPCPICTNFNTAHREFMKKKALTYLLIDILIVTVAFFIFIWIKPASKRIYLPAYYQPFLIFLALWIGVSLAIDKYRLEKKSSLRDILFPIVTGDFIILAGVTILIAVFQYFHYSRLIVFGTIFLSFFGELVLGIAYYYNKKLSRDAERFEAFLESSRLARQELAPRKPQVTERVAGPGEATRSFSKRLITGESGEAAYDYLRAKVNIGDPRTMIVSTSTQFNINTLQDYYYHTLVNLRKMNDMRRLNKFFETVNAKLPLGGEFICCVVPNYIRKHKFLARYPWGLNYFLYFFYYIFMRVFPKVPLLKKFYFFVTNGYDRAISRAEALGRLYSCGFEVVEENQVDGTLFITARKIGEPVFDLSPSYGPLVKLRRVGRDGRLFYVYKLRTMHPYAEYIQAYVYDKESLEDGGKFRNDFRVSTLGRLMRRFWIDELPMLVNLVRGDLKLVGVRPLSKHYFELYDPDLRQLRIRHRPGLIPPYYADMPRSLEEIQASELKYLQACEKRPFFTDWRYFWKAMYNIFLKKARSR
jgi:lipopolysaccharide/colanic/teichoic acid biosynthesis glycosyltransferase